MTAVKIDLGFGSSEDHCAMMRRMVVKRLTARRQSELTELYQELTACQANVFVVRIVILIALNRRSIAMENRAVIIIIIIIEGVLLPSHQRWIVQGSWDGRIDEERRESGMHAV